MNKNLQSGLIVLLLSSLACKPVFAIGWNELLFLALVITILLGPPLYKFLRRVEKFWKHRLKDK